METIDWIFTIWDGSLAIVLMFLIGQLVGQMEVHINGYRPLRNKIMVVLCGLFLIQCLATMYDIDMVDATVTSRIILKIGRTLAVIGFFLVFKFKPKHCEEISRVGFGEKQKPKEKK